MNTELVYSIDTFYFLMSGAFVMWMAAGFAMLEAGLVRSKNTTEILLKNISLFAVACIMYLLVGYNIMYPGDAYAGSWITDLSNFMLGGGVDAEGKAIPLLNAEMGTHSLTSDFFFQVVFVATAMSIVSGAVAERMKLWAFLVFAVVMTGFIYPVEGFWKWGGGALHAHGFQDFAGSGVVHLAGAAAALAGVLVLGPRKGKYGPNGEIHPIPGANLPLATLGTFILWLGWFGFNGGSQLALAGMDNANAVGMIFVNTNTAAAGGVIAAMVTARLLFGKADLTMALNGALAGLVAITAEPLTPTPGLATLVGAIGGVLVVFSIVFLDKIKIDDPVGAISVHGVVGMWGLLAVAFTNNSKDDKGEYVATLMGQMEGLAVIFAWVFITSLITWLLIKLVMGVRVSEEDEYNGVDLSECGMEAYPEFTNK